MDPEAGTSGPRGSRIKDHGPCFGTNEHPRRDTDVILRQSKAPLEPFNSRSEVGGVSPTGKSFRSFVRACVRAKLRVPARRCCFRGWAISRKESSGAARRRVPFPVVGLAVPSRRFPSLLSGFSLLPVASRCFPWLPVASRCFPCAFPLRISAYLCVWTLARLVAPLGAVGRACVGDSV